MLELIKIEIKNLNKDFHIVDFMSYILSTTTGILLYTIEYDIYKRPDHFLFKDCYMSMKEQKINMRFLTDNYYRGTAPQSYVEFSCGKYYIKLSVLEEAIMVTGEYLSNKRSQEKFSYIVPFSEIENTIEVDKKIKKC